MPSIAGRAGRIHYVEQGSGPPLLLSHGVIENVRSWERVMSLLARRFRTVAHDARGRGRSDGAEMSFADLVEDVLTLVRALDLGTVFHAGHSMGARVALQHALTDPDGVRAIALVSGRAGAPDAAGRRRLQALADAACP
jgi:pimeloyl-ACP methyl ester carboxylesterase